MMVSRPRCSFISFSARASFISISPNSSVTPNSLFFSRDRVAIDCVMTDLLVAEDGIGNKERAYDYLFCAQEAGLGVCEGSRSNPGGDPWQTPYGSGYSQIQYVRRDL